MILYKIDVQAVAASLTQPFHMEHLARVDHFAVYLYLCEGAVARHRHAVQDELFYVQQGSMALDTDWGRLDLEAGELAVVPRGVSHVSGSLVRTIVMLFQAQADPDRKNGHGRLTGDDPLATLPKWSVAAEAEQSLQSFLPMPVAQVDEMSLRVLWCEGATSWHAHEAHEELLLVTEGRLEVGTELGPLTMNAGELLVIPRDRIHRLAARQRTVVVSFIHGEVSPTQHMGY